MPLGKVWIQLYLYSHEDFIGSTATDIFAANNSQVNPFRVQPKNWSKKCLSYRADVWSSNALFTPMKTERVPMPAEVNRTRPNGWPSLPVQRCHNFRMKYVRQSIYIYIYIYTHTVRWQKLLGSARGGSTALSYRICVIALVGGWWG